MASSGKDAILPFCLSSLILTGKCTTLIDRERFMVLSIRTPGLKLVWEADGLEIDLLPLQGLWTEEQYLRLTDQTNRLIEFTEGSVEILPMPTRKHQAISRYLFLALLTFVERIGGTVFYAPLRVRVAPNRFREPDLVGLYRECRCGVRCTVRG